MTKKKKSEYKQLSIKQIVAEIKEARKDPQFMKALAEFRKYHTG